MKLKVDGLLMDVWTNESPLSLFLPFSRFVLSLSLSLFRSFPFHSPSPSWTFFLIANRNWKLVRNQREFLPTWMLSWLKHWSGELLIASPFSSNFSLWLESWFCPSYRIYLPWLSGGCLSLSLSPTSQFSSSRFHSLFFVPRNLDRLDAVRHRFS